MALRFVAIKKGIETTLVSSTVNVLTIEEFNSAFDFENAINAGYAIGMKFPVAGNEYAFDFAHIKSIIDRDAQIPIYVYDGAEVKYRGALLLNKIVKDGENAYYECDFVSANFNMAIFEKTLQDACDEEIILGANVHDIIETINTEINVGSWPDQKCSFIPTKADKFYDETEHMTAFGGVLNYYDRYGAVMPQNGVGEVTYSIAPSIYLLEVLKQIFNKYGYSISGTVLENARMKKVCVLGLHALDEIGFVSTAVVKKNTLMTVTGFEEEVDFDEVVSDFTDDQSVVVGTNPYNVTSGTAYYHVITIKTGDNCSTAHLYIQRTGGGSPIAQIDDPQPNTTYVLAFVHTYAASVAEGLKLTITLSGDICDVTSVEWNVREASSTVTLWNKWRGKFKIGDALPRISIADFLRAVRKTYNIRIDIDDVSRSAVLSLNSDVFDNVEFIEIETYSNKHILTNNKKRKISIAHGNENFDITGFEFLGRFDLESSVGGLTPTPNWPGALLYLRGRNLYYKDNISNSIGGIYRSESVGEGTEEIINTGITIPAMVFEGLIDDPTQFYYPHWKEKGTSYWGELGENDFPLMFINNMGFDTHLGGTPDHVFATPYNLNIDGPKLDVYSLAPLNEEGTIWYDLWLPWLSRYIGGDEIEISTPIDINRFDRGTFYFLEGVRFLAKSQKLPIGKSDGWKKLVLYRM